MNLTPCLVCTKYTEASFRRQVSFHCPFTIQKAIGDTKAVQQSTSTNYLAVTQASLNNFKDYPIFKQPIVFCFFLVFVFVFFFLPVWTFAGSLSASSRYLTGQ